MNDFHHWGVVDVSRVFTARQIRAVANRYSQRTSNLPILTVLESFEGYQNLTYHLRPYSHEDITAMIEAERKHSERTTRETQEEKSRLRALKLQELARRESN